VKVKEMAGKNI